MTAWNERAGQPGEPGEPGTASGGGRGGRGGAGGVGGEDGSGGTGGAGGAGGSGGTSGPSGSGSRGPILGWLMMLSLSLIATLMLASVGFYLERQDSNEIRSNTDRLTTVARETCEIQRRDLHEQRYIVGASRGFNRFLLLPPLVSSGASSNQAERQRRIVLEIRRNLQGYIAIEERQPATRVC